MRLTEAQYQALIKGREKKEAKPKRVSKLAEPGSGHQWTQQGKRYVCTCCGMGLPAWAWPEWHKGYYDPA